MLNNDYRDILSGFATENVRYLLVGAYALAVHGHPRATGDIDLWIDSNSENAARVIRALATFGASLEDITVEDLSSPNMVIQIGIVPRRIDILTSIDGVDHFANAWDTRHTVDIDGISVPVIGRTDLIINKRATGRLQDLADVERLDSED